MHRSRQVAELRRHEKMSVVREKAPRVADELEASRSAPEQVEQAFVIHSVDAIAERALPRTNT